MTAEELHALPVAFGPEPTFRALNIGRTKGYELLRNGAFPIRVLRLGDRYRFTRADLFRYLGITDNDQDGARSA